MRKRSLLIIFSFLLIIVQILGIVGCKGEGISIAADQKLNEYISSSSIFKGLAQRAGADIYAEKLKIGAVQCLYSGYAGFKNYFNDIISFFEQTGLEYTSEQYAAAYCRRELKLENNKIALFFFDFCGFVGYFITGITGTVILMIGIIISTKEKGKKLPVEKTQTDIQIDTLRKKI